VSVQKSWSELQTMARACRIVVETLDLLEAAAQPGVTTKQLDRVAREAIVKAGARPAFLGYRDYPATLCISVNEEIVHGIPGKRVIQDGDIVSLDLGCTYKGFVADMAVTVGVGNVSREAQRLIDVTKEALWCGIGAARGGSRVGDIGHAIQTRVEAEGFSVVQEYVGHGVGRQMHEDPQIPNYGTPETGTVLRPGMVIAIEPMVNIGDWRTKRDADNWTVRTLDGSLSAHFEHTLAIADGEAEVLTLP